MAEEALTYIWTDEDEGNLDVENYLRACRLADRVSCFPLTEPRISIFGSQNH